MESPISILSQPIDVPCPEGMEFYPYQKEGILFARGKERVLIGDQMGLGKTPQAIGIINDNPSFRSVLVICPAILKINWERELDVWLYNKDISVSIANNRLPDSDIVIVNYEKLGKLDVRSRQWDMIIIDEAHYIKNDKANRTREIVGFRDKPALKAKKYVLLTGTPMTNRPLDMWTICHFCEPQTFKNKWSYLSRYCLHPDPRKHRMFGRWDFSQSNNEQELASKLSKFMIRRFKRDVLPQLPEKRYSVIELQTTGNQRKLIEQEHTLASFAADSDRVKVGFSDVSTVREELGREKTPSVIRYLDDVLEDYEGKIVVFAHHRKVLERLKEHFQGMAALVYGEMSGIKKQEQIDAFVNDNRVRVFLGSISSAGIGINLTNASKLFFAEMDYVPAKMDQAEDRIHRATQKSDTVDITYLVFKGSLDANIAWSIVGKKNVINKVVGG